MKNVFSKTLPALALALLAATATPAVDAQVKPTSQHQRLSTLLPPARPLPARRPMNQTILSHRAPQAPLAGKKPQAPRKVRPTQQRESAWDYDPIFAGCAIYYDNWESDGIGAFQFAPDDMGLTPLYVSNELDAQYGGIAVGNKLFVAYQQNILGLVTMNVGRVIDMDTWQTVISTSALSDDMFSYSMAQDPTDGQIYGCFYAPGQTGFQFGTADIDQLSRTSTITPVLAKPWVAMGFTADGQLYAVDLDSNVLRVDKTTGETETVGFGGLEFKYMSGGFMDQEHQAFYVEVCNDWENAIYQIDLDNFWADYVCEVPQEAEFMVMWPGKKLASPLAPARVQDLACSFVDASLTGTVTFTAPSTTYGGEPLSGMLDYTVYVDDDEVATGNVEAGERAEVEITVANSGTHIVTVRVSNESGESPVATLKQWIGYDRPNTVRNIRITRQGNVNTISWDPVIRGANNGFFDPDDLTYNVRRLPDDVVVATGIKATSTQDVVDAPVDLTVYTYNVCAVQHGVVGEEGESNNAAPLGSVDLPFAASFDDWDQFSMFSTINANGDNRYWKWNANGTASVLWNTEQAMDDWLITPGLRMEQGRTYDFSFDYFCAGSDVPERIEAFFGLEPTAQGLDIRATEAIDLQNDTPQTCHGQFTAPTTGIYYLGLHGCSDADMYELFVDNVEVQSGVVGASPEACAVTLTHEPSGTTAVTGEITAPTTDIDGDALTSLESIIVKRNGQLVASVGPIQPGQTVTFTDKTDEPGYVSYLIAACNHDGGTGRTTKHNFYMGVNYAAAPEQVSLIENGNSGEVTMSWPASDRDIDGYPMASELVSYNIYDNKSNQLGKTAELSYTLQAVTEGQKFVNYMIAPRTERGENLTSPAATEMIPVGKPYALPYNENLSGGNLDYRYAQEGEGSWSVYNLTSSHSVFEYIADKRDDQGTLLTGKIDLATATSPFLGLSVYAYDGYDGYTPNTNQLAVEVRDLQNGTSTVVQTIEMNQGHDWVRYLIDLSEFQGRTVQIGLRSITNISGYATYIDRLSLVDTPDFDVAILHINTPAKATIGQEMEFRVLYENTGSQPASDYAINLQMDGRTIDTLKGQELQPGEQGTAMFTIEASALMSSTTAFGATVEYADDGNEENNYSDIRFVNIAHSNGATVNDLKAEISDNGAVALTWSEPSQVGTLPDALTDTFESYEPFLPNEAGDWTFVDCDGAQTYGVEPEFPNVNSKMAYMVFDNRYADYGDEYAMMSGTKCLGSFAAYPAPNDDWAISPRLNPTRQSVSFYARSLTTQYGAESFEVYTSNKGNDLEDFEPYGNVDAVPGDWTLYTMDLDEGTNYFAIRCTSNDRLLLMIDDVTFIPYASSARTLLGYNVYRNGAKLNADTPIEACVFTDTEVPDGQATYLVTVVYDSGESLPSNEASVILTAIDAIGANATAVEYFDLLGRRVAHPGNGVYIKVQDGKATKIMR